MVGLNLAQSRSRCQATKIRNDDCRINLSDGISLLFQLLFPELFLKNSARKPRKPFAFDKAALR